MKFVVLAIASLLVSLPAQAVSIPNGASVKASGGEKDCVVFTHQNGRWLQSRCNSDRAFVEYRGFEPNSITVRTGKNQLHWTPDGTSMIPNSAPAQISVK